MEHVTTFLENALRVQRGRKQPLSSNWQESTPPFGFETWWQRHAVYHGGRLLPFLSLTKTYLCKTMEAYGKVCSPGQKSALCAPNEHAFLVTPHFDGATEMNDLHEHERNEHFVPCVVSLLKATWFRVAHCVWFIKALNTKGETFCGTYKECLTIRM